MEVLVYLTTNEFEKTYNILLYIFCHYMYIIIMDIKINLLIDTAYLIMHSIKICNCVLYY